MPKTKKPPKLENLGSLITYKDRGADTCLGDLLVAEGHGVYDPELGMVDVTPEQAETHNRLLSEALIKGLDERCEVGMGGNFYVHRGPPPAVKTWAGEVVSADVTVAVDIWLFRRGGKTFRGVKARDSDNVFFRRIK